ncbi:DUF2169 family type VI secretion system accessory protein [Roseibium sp. Sym1]|uniref:DUF2169 family type VI secretion system accessory protein n=1 Tax=Roseibium sp. Sym1 TaxID=3016006 RepID=UPI0022B37CA7|nr:DUF2169 domain-containing protein [Roseibium sp. Sym1]
MPAIVKPSKLSAALQPQAVEGGSLLTVSAFLLFDIDDPYTLYTEQALWPMVAEQMPDGGIFDKGQLKPRAEMIVAGHALAPGHLPVTALKVTARLGGKTKRLAVFGDRFWRLTDRGAEMTSPVPFDKVPICETSAFGGEGYPPNLKGKGFGASRLIDAGYDAPLPNVENADALILSPGDMPKPAHFGPIGPDNPDRLKLAGTYDTHWVKHVSPLKPADFNPLFHCDAPEDQRFSTYLAGGETFSVTGMCRSGQPVAGTLPGFRVRAFIHRLEQDSLTETDMVCDTATLFPNVRKATMAFRGVARCSERFAEDIGSVMLAVELAGEAPRPREYYEGVFRLRTDPEEAYKYALADHQLMPETDPGIRLAKRRERLERAEAERQKFLEDSDWHFRKTMDDAGLPADLLPPVDPDRAKDIPLLGLPTAEEIASGDFDIAELIEDVEQFEKQMNTLADQEFARAEGLQRKVDAATPSDISSLFPSRPLAGEKQLTASLPPGDVAGESADSLADLPDSLEQTMRENIDLEKLSSSSDEAGAKISEMFDRLADLKQSPEETSSEQYRLACARALRLPEGSPLYPIKRQLAEMQLDTSSLPASLDDPASLLSDRTAAQLEHPLEPPSGETGAQDEVDLFGALGKAGEISDFGTQAADTSLKAALDPAEQALAEHCSHLIEEGMEDQPLAAVQEKLKKVALPEDENADMPLLDRLEQINEDLKASLDSLEPRFAETLATGRQLSPQALFPQEPLLPGVAVAVGTVVEKKLAQGHDFKGADLAGLRLGGLDFSDRDLSGTFFEQSDLTGACFRNCCLDGAVFTSARLDNAVFEGASLAGVNFSGASLRDTNLKGAKLARSTVICADLTGAQAAGAEIDTVTFLECTLDDSDFQGSRIEQVRVTRGSAARLGMRQADLDSVLFIDLPLHQACFAGSTLTQAVFTQVAAKGADFTAAEMRETGFHGGCDLAAARFEGIRATETTWNGAFLEESLYMRASCKSCLFNQCDMQWVDGRAASFKNARFLQSDLKYSDFCAADFFSASLSQTDLRRVSMRHANLYGADLMDAKLASCDLSNANLGNTAMNHAVSVPAQ